MLPYGIRLEDDTAFIRQSTGFNWLGFTFLAEMDHIEDKSISHISGKYEEQRISFVEVNREITKGLNIKVTAEYLDPETNIDENERVRHSL